MHTNTLVMLSKLVVWPVILRLEQHENGGRDSNFALVEMRFWVIIELKRFTEKYVLCSDSVCYKQRDSLLASGLGYQRAKKRAARAENSRSESCNFKLADCSEYNSVTSHVASFLLSDSTEVTFASSPARTEGCLKHIISCKL